MTTYKQALCQNNRLEPLDLSGTGLGGFTLLFVSTRDEHIEAIKKFLEKEGLSDQFAVRKVTVRYPPESLAEGSVEMLALETLTTKAEFINKLSERMPGIVDSIRRVAIATELSKGFKADNGQ